MIKCWLIKIPKLVKQKKMAKKQFFWLVTSKSSENGDTG